MITDQTAFENGHHVLVVLPDGTGLDVANEETLTAREQREYSEDDYRMAYRRCQRWVFSGEKESILARALVVGLHFCPELWGYPSQRALAAEHGILVASLNRFVREFERIFKMRLKNQKSNTARAAYQKAAKKRHKQKKTLCK